MDLLGAVQMFPAFCGEVAEGETRTIRDVCKEELVAFWTYMLFAEKTPGTAYTDTTYDFISNTATNRHDETCITMEAEGLANQGCILADST